MWRAKYQINKSNFKIHKQTVPAEKKTNLHYEMNMRKQSEKRLSTHLLIVIIHLNFFFPFLGRKVMGSYMVQVNILGLLSCNLNLVN
jgi:hypothetical protein